MFIVPEASQKQFDTHVEEERGGLLSLDKQKAETLRGNLPFALVGIYHGLMVIF
jgi:hypothetical protein